MLAPVRDVVRVEVSGCLVAETRVALQVLETASPPTIYIPPGDVDARTLAPNGISTCCEWKGAAEHFDVAAGGRRSPDAAWAYPDPFPEFAAIRAWLAFHPARVDRCLVGDEAARAQPGGYYGGWVTSDLAGPFKGEPGSQAW